eukprot:scaffold13.g282.t1
MHPLSAFAFSLRPLQVLINRLRRHKQSLGQEAAFGPRVSLRCATVLRVAARSMRQWVERLFGELEATAGTGGGQPAAGTAPAQEDGPGRRDAAVPTRRRAALAQEAGERGEPPPPELPLPPPQGGGPVLVLHLGVDDRGECFKLERRAVNDATFRVPDMDGFRPSHEPVDGKLELGAKLRTDLDLISLRDRLRARCSSPLRISHDAGRYVCNWTYFLSLEHAQVAREAGRAVHVLFVHVPPFRVIPEAQQFAFLLELLSQLAMLLAAPRPAAERAARCADEDADEAAWDTAAKEEAAAPEPPAAKRPRRMLPRMCAQQ